MTTRAASGQRDRIVDVQYLVESRGGSGAPIESWLPLTTVHAHKSDLSQRERFISDQQSAPADTRWSLPYSEDYDPELIDVAKKRRLVYRGRAYDIVSALMIGRRDGVEIVTLSGGLLT